MSTLFHDAGEAVIYAALLWFGLIFAVGVGRGIWITVKRQWK